MNIALVIVAVIAVAGWAAFLYVAGISRKNRKDADTAFKAVSTSRSLANKAERKANVLKNSLQRETTQRAFFEQRWMEVSKDEHIRVEKIFEDRAAEVREQNKLDQARADEHARVKRETSAQIRNRQGNRGSDSGSFIAGSFFGSSIFSDGGSCGSGSAGGCE